jgi:cell division protein FtsW
VSATAAAPRRRREAEADRRPRPRVPSRPAPPLEHRILMTATLCLLALGAVMVYSASAPTDLLGAHGGNGAATFERYVIYCAIGLLGMQLLAKRGMSLVNTRTTRLLLIASYCLLVTVLMPGFGVQILGARRWFAAGPLQFQPSELVKVALILHVARFLADHPRQFKTFRHAVAPIAIAAGPACLLIVIEPDLGTTLVVVFCIVALMFGANMPARYILMTLAIVAGAGLMMVLAKPYMLARLTSFVHPWSVARAGGYQSVQGQIALGSGGLFGVGLGGSVQKVFYLPEAQTDFILAVIGEELGVLGIFGVICLYGMIGYAGLRTARRAAGRYAKLLAVGLTSLILCQGILNIFVVLGLAPLTGVPLPFISYAPTNLWVMLGAVGLLLNIASPATPRLRVVDPKPRESAEDRDRRRRDRGARRARTGGRGRAEG